MGAVTKAHYVPEASYHEADFVFLKTKNGRYDCVKNRYGETLQGLSFREVDLLVHAEETVHKREMRVIYGSSKPT